MLIRMACQVKACMFSLLVVRLEWADNSGVVFEMCGLSSWFLARQYVED